MQLPDALRRYNNGTGTATVQQLKQLAFMVAFEDNAPCSGNF